MCLLRLSARIGWHRTFCPNTPAPILLSWISSSEHCPHKNHIRAHGLRLAIFVGVRHLCRRPSYRQRADITSYRGCLRSRGVQHPGLVGHPHQPREERAGRPGRQWIELRRLGHSAIEHACLFDHRARPVVVVMRFAGRSDRVAARRGSAARRPQGPEPGQTRQSGLAPASSAGRRPAARLPGRAPPPAPAPGRLTCDVWTNGYGTSCAA